MVHATERSQGGPVPAVLMTLLLVLGLLVGGATAASAAPPSGRAGPAAYTGELTPEQLTLVLDSGIDRHEVRTTPGAPGSVRVEVVLGERAANALIAQGVPLEVRTSFAAASDQAVAGVFRPWTGPVGCGRSSSRWRGHTRTWSSRR